MIFNVITTLSVKLIYIYSLGIDLDLLQYMIYPDQIGQHINYNFVKTEKHIIELLKNLNHSNASLTEKT